MSSLRKGGGRYANLGQNPRRYRPKLERIEDRLLPGETLGSLLVPGNLFADLLRPAESRLDNSDNLAAVAPQSAVTANPNSVANSSAVLQSGLTAPIQGSARDDSGQLANQASAGNFIAANGQTNASDTLAMLTAALNHPAQPHHAAIAPTHNPLTSPLGGEQGFRQSPFQGLHGAGTVGYWGNYGHDPQHSGIADRASQSLAGIKWQTLVDTNPGSAGGTHYASPVITAANTVIIGVNHNGSTFFRVEGHDGYTGRLKWSVNTDYQLPPSSGWTTPLPITLTPQNRLYFAGAGGTVYYIDNPDDDGAGITGQFAFYGIQQYSHTFDSRLYINTPLTPDANGSIYFGFRLTNTVLNLQSGLARQDFDGTGTWNSALQMSGGVSGVDRVATNCAPALTNDQSSLYVTVTVGTGTGYLVEVDTASLSHQAHVRLRDVARPNNDALVSTYSTASPTVGPDGDVYFGVLASPDNNDRGWLLHYSSDLSQTLIPGAFGWDDTASVVPSYMVPSYGGTSSYLLMTKYNNYAGIGTGDGTNRIAVLDPNATESDPVTHATTMNEILTILGPTRDPDFPGYPNAVREWCINAAAVDPYTNSILVNSEDGHRYRWDMNTNTLLEGLPLNPAFSEPYTPTLVGPDGTVYAINHGTLYAAGTM